ncbi:hypothetical protein [Rhodoferax ferrireducens]|uniref:hypothetical protein n=1 Tax=Rhodoferax ferrireducens TaxID=192843 RepID=UPI003BB6E81E
MKASTPLDAHDQQPPLCEIDPMDAPCHPMVYPLFFELAALVARLCASRALALVVFHPALLSPGIALTKGMPALAALGVLGFHDLHQPGHGTTCSNFSNSKSSCHRWQ